MEEKLRNLITNMSANDEGLMSYCLELNDDLMKVYINIILRHLKDMKHLNLEESHCHLKLKNSNSIKHKNKINNLNHHCHNPNSLNVIIEYYYIEPIGAFPSF